LPALVGMVKCRRRAWMYRRRQLSSLITFYLLTMQPQEGAQFVAQDRMRAWRALLEPTDV
jgi:hypothetical protein